MSAEPDETRGWLLRARAGDEDAFGNLVRAFGPAVYRLALHVTRDAQDAEDAAQEAFLRAWRALDRFDCGRPFGPWIFKIAVRRAMTKARARRGAPTVGEAAEPAEPREAGPDADSAGAGLREALAGLGPGDRAVLALKYERGMTTAEIAAALDIGEGAAKVRLFRARERLLGLMGEDA